MAQEPPQEDLNYTIVECIPEPRMVNVWVEELNEIRQIAVFVAGITDQQVYIKSEIMKQTPINHGGPDWGAVYYGHTLERMQGYEPPVFCFALGASERIDVAIKVLEKRIFQPLLAQNATREDPYREIHRMQTQSLTDGGYVLPLVEALEDDHYLYIITPYADGGDLTNSIPLQPQQNMPVELQAYKIFKQMLDCLNHTHNNPHVRDTFGIGHRDIKGGNFFVKEDRILLADFAMSFPIPPGDMVSDMGGFGTPAYLPPEIAREGEFSAKGCDLWACTVTLFNLVAGMPVYMMPIPTDIFFVYSIMARGLSNDPNGEMIEALLEEADDTGRGALRQMWQQIESLSPQLRELLSNVLQLAPDQRWNMQDVQNSAWMQLAAAVQDR
ncbi:MAG: hypothetical protein SGBAC_002212 [Bacillariaceae sp.]